MMAKKKRKFSLISFLFQSMLFGLFLLALFFGAIYIGLFGPLPSKADLSSIRQENASLIYSADRHIIGKVFAKNRTQIDSAAMPKFLLDALVATEDRRFFEHEGVDYKSYLRVIVRSIILQDKSGGGGSTITQQLIKNLYGRSDFGFLSMPITKIKEALIASRLEEIYSKHQILVLYFNTVPFGEDVWGVEAAASRYFNKHVNDISLPQAALLVGMLKANTTFNPRLYPEAAQIRRNTVLGLMAEVGFINEEELIDAQKSGLQLDYTNYALYNPSGHFTYQVTQEARRLVDDYNQSNRTKLDIEKDGLIISTTLNYSLQEYAVASIRKQLVAKQSILNKELRNSGTYKRFVSKHKNLAKDTSRAARQVFSWQADKPKKMSRLDSAWAFESTLHASMLALDPKNGDVLVWVGGNNYRYLPYDLVMAKRQAASSFKPIVYAAALEAGFNSCDYFSNEEVTYAEFDNWTPQNYNGQSGDDAAMWYALSKSLNLPTVDLYMQTGHEQVEHTAADLGIVLPHETRPAIALGSESVSLLEMTLAYAAFANNGYMQEPKLITEIQTTDGQIIYSKSNKQRRALDEVTALRISSMLLAAVKEGTGKSMHSIYGLKADIAGKTGTSQNYSDAWFMSYTQDLVCGVWVGAMSPDIHFESGANGSGSALALPIAARFYISVEGNTLLRPRYLKGFSIMQGVTDTFACEGMQEHNAIKRMMDKIIPDNEQRKAERKARREQRRHERDERQKKAKEEEGWLKKTWKKVFKKK